MVCWSLFIKKIVVVLLLLNFNTHALVSVGKGLLTFTFLKIEVYELELKSKDKVSSLTQLQEQEEFELTFTFKKDIDKKYLKQAWIEAKKQLQNKEKNLSDMPFDKLVKAQPDMKKGEQIKIIAKNSRIEFIFSSEVVVIEDKDFIKNIPWIWLGDNEVGEKLSPQIFKKLPSDISQSS